MSNLELIDSELKRAKAEGKNVDWYGPYEVTQLVNSFMGAMVHPWERVWSVDRKYSPQGTEDIQSVLSEIDVKCGEVKGIGETLGMFRNGFSHGNIEFLKSGNDIGAIRIWNCQPRGGRKTFEATISIPQLRRFLEAFVRLAETLERLEDNVQPDCRTPNDLCP